MKSITNLCEKLYCAHQKKLNLYIITLNKGGRTK